MFKIVVRYLVGSNLAFGVHMVESFGFGTLKFELPLSCIEIIIEYFKCRGYLVLLL